MNQQEIDKQRAKIIRDISILENNIKEWRKDLSDLHNLEIKLDDPHALIPNSYKSMDEWVDGHPFPESCLSMIYKNRADAEDVQMSSYNYTFDYHVVKYSPQ